MNDKHLRWIIGLLLLFIAVPIRNIVAEGAPPSNGARIGARPGRTPLVAATEPQSIVPVTPSATPASVPSEVSTPASSKPVLTVGEPTNCRSGPGTSHDIIVTYQPGKVLEIAGRDESGKFWLVRSPESPTGSCWMWGEFVAVAGSHSTLPIVAGPPTPSLLPPRAPSLYRYEYFCNSIENTFRFSLIWEDRADNEAGYRIYRDGQAIADLPAGSTSFGELIPMPATRTADYFVQAYNAYGAAEGSGVRLVCE